MSENKREWETSLEFMANDDPVCPHCRHEIREPWEFFRGSNNEAEVDCPSCNKLVQIVQEIVVQYTTYSERQPSSLTTAPETK